MRPVVEHRLASDQETIQLLNERAEEPNCPEVFPEEMEEALAHLGGYLAHSVRKTHKCSECVKNLADQHDEHPERAQYASEDSGDQLKVKGFTELLNRGRLMRPSPVCLQLVKEICLLYRSVTEDDNRTILFGTSNPKRVFQGIVAERMKENDDFRHIACEGGHVLVEQTLITMAGSLFNAFTSNYVNPISGRRGCFYPPLGFFLKYLPNGLS